MFGQYLYFSYLDITFFYWCDMNGHPLVLLLYLNKRLAPTSTKQHGHNNNASGDLFRETLHTTSRGAFREASRETLCEAFLAAFRETLREAFCKQSA